ncbi:uncharacterized protein JCM6883_002878 [Sporobolomyces salmoneus]|uniref:uncharacterized protein n=1 Tax=Sporobolomyces salmoneus TaxID=183962 RepID=UPI00317C2605
MGVQRSGRNSYDVKVKIDTVDIESGTLAGTLEIKHLTPELESLVTFFEGEIVSESGPGFLTSNYGATKEDDMRHWRRFPPFTRNRLEQQMTGTNLNLRGASKKPYLFMRWKERFVLPEHKVDAIHGASFAGLYYVCLDFEPTSSELFAEASSSVQHRGISPPSSRPFSFAAPLPRRRSSSNSQTAPSQLAQTRPAPVSALLTASTPPVSIVERPASSPRSVSYAAALRGEGGQTSTSPSSSIAASSLSSLVSSTPTSSVLSVTPPTPSTTPPPPELPTPKSEYESVETALLASQTSFIDLTQSPEVATSHPMLSPTPPVVPFNDMASERAESEWPTIPSSPPPLPSSPPRLHHDISSFDQTRSSRGRKNSHREDEVENFGLKSWTEATLTGFYHFACSEPYQQLSLKYVPTTQGGSQAFEFA